MNNWLSCKRHKYQSYVAVILNTVIEIIQANHSMQGHFRPFFTRSYTKVFWQRRFFMPFIYSPSLSPFSFFFVHTSTLWYIVEHSEEKNFSIDVQYDISWLSSWYDSRHHFTSTLWYELSWTYRWEIVKEIQINRPFNLSYSETSLYWFSMSIGFNQGSQPVSFDKCFRMTLCLTDA
jgi:hypothetical protein